MEIEIGVPAAIIALGGAKHAGKTEGCRLLERVFPGARRFAFADALKRSAQALYNLSDSQVYGDLKDVIDDRYNCTPRALLLKMGDEARARDPDLFVRHFLEFYEANKFAAPVILVEDWRLVIEGEALAKLGACLVLVFRGDGGNNANIGANLSEAPTHATEDPETLRKVFGSRAQVVYNVSCSRKQYLMDLLEAIPLELP